MKQTKNILLINPWVVDFKAYDLWMKPLGLLYLASILEKNGFQVNFVDCMDRLHPSLKDKVKIRQDKTGKFPSRETDKPHIYKNIPRKYKIYGIDKECFISDIHKKGEPALIMVTSIMTYWYPGAHHAIEILKEEFPRTPVLLGGIYATLCEEFANNGSGADMVIPGGSIPQILKIIKKITGVDLKFIPWDIREFPYPALHHYHRHEYGVVLGSVGCPFHCTYCASKKLQPSFIQRDSHDVVREIEYLYSSYGVENIAFYDDALLLNPNKFIIPLLTEILDKKLPLKFHAPNGLHIRMIDSSMADLMKRAGFRTIRLSLESSSPQSQKEFSSDKVSTADFVQAVENLRKAGFSSEEIAVYVLAGLPGTSAEECSDTLDLVYSLGVQSRVSDFTPVPHTKEFYIMKETLGDAIEDPLLQNNTFFQYSDFPLTRRERQFLRDKSFTLNKDILNK